MWHSRSEGIFLEATFALQPGSYSREAVGYVMPCWCTNTHPDTHSDVRQESVGSHRGGKMSWCNPGQVFMSHDSPRIDKGVKRRRSWKLELTQSVCSSLCPFLALPILLLFKCICFINLFIYGNSSIGWCDDDFSVFIFLCIFVFNKVAVGWNLLEINT